MTPMDDRAWECSMCDEYSAELAVVKQRAEEAERLRALWFNESGRAQAALGRVRELCNEWAASGGVYRRHADLVHSAIDGDVLVTEQEPAASCTACDYGYPSSACSSDCDCAACR